MISWIKKSFANTASMTGRDRFGYSVDVKPRFPLQKWFERMVARVTVPEDQQLAIEELSRRGTVV